MWHGDVATDINELNAMRFSALRKRALASGCDEDEVEAAVDQNDGQAKRALVDMIVVSEAILPAGWAACDGTRGTPDLRDRFVVGAGGEHAAGSAGGGGALVAGGGIYGFPK